MRIVLVMLSLLLVNPLYSPHPLGSPLIIINKTTNELAYYHQGKFVVKEKVATGKTNELTPEGLFTVKVKAEHPYYRKKDIPGGDPRNPLGTRWVGFDAKGTDGRIYGIHGTNNPSSIGKYISNGCIRMRNSAVELLYEKVPINTKVLIVSTNESFDSLAKKHGVIK